MVTGCGCGVAVVAGAAAVQSSVRVSRARRVSGGQDGALLVVALAGDRSAGDALLARHRSGRAIYRGGQRAVRDGGSLIAFNGYGDLSKTSNNS